MHAHIYPVGSGWHARVPTDQLDICTQPDGADMAKGAYATPSEARRAARTAIRREWAAWRRVARMTDHHDASIPRAYARRIAGTYAAI